MIFDGGCPFCQFFAESSALKGGLPRLEIIDGRANHQLRHALKAQGYSLSRGAILMVDFDGNSQVFHGSAAITLLCRQLQPSPGLLQLLKAVFASEERTAFLYPLLLWTRRPVLGWRGLSIDPDHC